MEKRIFKVEGMKCNKCTDRIERVMNDMEEIVSVNCDLEGKSVEIESDMSTDELKELIEELGFDVV